MIFMEFRRSAFSLAAFSSISVNFSTSAALADMDDSMSILCWVSSLSLDITSSSSGLETFSAF